GVRPRPGPRRPGPDPHAAEDPPPLQRERARARRGRFPGQPALSSDRRAPPRVQQRGRCVLPVRRRAVGSPPPHGAHAQRAPARQPPAPVARRALPSILRWAPATLPGTGPERGLSQQAFLGQPPAGTVPLLFERRRAKPASATMWFGGLPERSNGAVLKTAGGRKVARGFKSHPRRSPFTHTRRRESEGSRRPSRSSLPFASFSRL